MSVQNAYNHWANTYDTDDNLTRDLDVIVTKNALENLQYHSILELGCGTGKNTLMLAQMADCVLALDFSQEMLAKAKEKVTAINVKFEQANLLQEWPIRNQSADLIVCNLVLEHIENLEFIFAEATRSLKLGGQFFICELHPFKQYLGSQANFTQGDENLKVQAFVHHISDFLDVASRNGFVVKDLGEWWHEQDGEKPPRLVSFMFEKRG